MESPVLDIAVGMYEEALHALLAAVAETGRGDFRAVVDSGEDVEDGELEYLVGRYLRASTELGEVLLAGAPEEPDDARFQTHALRRLSAAAAGDLLAVEALALLGATTSSAIADLDMAVSEDPPLFDDELRALLRRGSDPFPLVLDEMRETHVDVVLRALGGGPVVGATETMAADAVGAVRATIDEVVATGASTLERTVLAGLTTFGPSIAGHVATFFDDRAFEDVGGMHWLVRKVVALLRAARDKVLAIVGTNGVEAVSRALERVLGPLADRIEGELLRQVLDIGALEEDCHRRLAALSDDPGREQALSRLGPVPVHAQELSQWAGFGATAIRVARTLQVFGRGGTLWPILLAMSVGLSGYTLWVVQDHLDWPGWGWVPDRFPGVRLLLSPS